ncbi:cyclodeaminase/cyclohydrolase family protein [Blastococcus sp. PRF04-17]|uniref:cyclodeaminase/cyclohydrolase family protein n=1 Tax=Blastococcus sp. PRF04-17 TaxID=2933797 RepID=UPI001FF1F55C|nr:cyclodeaminase/cyclohydrolase family protein [Blastococcus sp. PRF04-17]UOY02569.1 cyclodeaminase/cyclohydrolase family protein [Blastococcus sp. PRF04-17]
MQDRGDDAGELDRQPLGEFLGQLAARMPAPGAGATAAVEAALGASLLAMVGRFTTAEEHADTVRAIVAAADAERDACLAAAAADERAFGAVADAMKLPRESPGEQERRRRSLSAAQLDAAGPPRAVIGSAARLVDLAERILPIANPNLVSDVAAATAAARAAAGTARLAVETNLPGISDERARRELRTATDSVDDLARRADGVEADVRARLRA